MDDDVDGEVEYSLHNGSNKIYGDVQNCEGVNDNVDVRNNDID